ncbi:MAG TPA: hypothetical protein ENF33_03950 [Nitrososphaeria archaeon]|nr:hypothetical protein [Nitrososphaeria archaeon]
MSSVEELRDRLARIHITLKVNDERVKSLLEEVLDAGRSVGLNPESRVEGFALTPSHEAAVIGLPHLRIARIGDLLMVWVRAPYSLDQGKCRSIGLSADELYEMLLAGARKIAEILRRYSKSAEYLEITLP